MRAPHPRLTWDESLISDDFDSLIRLILAVRETKPGKRELCTRCIICAPSSPSSSFLSFLVSLISITKDTFSSLFVPTVSPCSFTSCISGCLVCDSRVPVCALAHGPESLSLCLRSRASCPCVVCPKVPACARTLLLLSIPGTLHFLLLLPWTACVCLCFLMNRSSCEGRSFR